MPIELSALIDKAKSVELTNHDREEHRRSFVYGNTAIENPRITRQMVDECAEALSNRR